jgi:hypothetical protein
MRAMLFVAVFVAATAVAADATDGGPEPETDPTVVQLVWCDPARILPERFDEMAREVSAIFRPLGVDVTWRRANDRPASGDELNVILLPADPAVNLHRRATLGRVERTEHTALWIFAGRVRQTIGLTRAPIMRATLEDQRDYPRALGRVVAHELVHAIAPLEPHADRGLMQASLNRAVLTGPRLTIDGRCARAFIREFQSRSTQNRAVLAAQESVGAR